MGLRAKEDGKSESRSVMERIGVKPKGNITPRESGQTSIWSLVTRELEKTGKEDKADDGSIDYWCGLPPRVRWRQVRIVKATQYRWETASLAGRLRGLS